MQLRLTYVLLLVVCFFCSACSTQLSVGRTIKYNRNHWGHIHIGKENIVWDTGTDGSIFFRDFSSRKTWLGPMVLIDYSKRWRVNMMYYSPSMTFDSITIKHVYYHLMRKDKVVTYVKNRGVDGILGMNVISKANWLINCKDSTLQVMAQDEVYDVTAEPLLSLNYKKRLRPKIALEVAGITIENVLIDSGSEVSDITLLKEDIEQIHRHIVPVDTVSYFSSGLYSDSIPDHSYTYHNITVNGYTFDTLEIRQSNFGRSIGTGFFNKFSTVYLNTKEKVFRFY